MSDPVVSDSAASESASPEREVHSAWPRFDVVAFAGVALSAFIYSVWVLVIDRHFFSRLYVLPCVAALWLAALYFFLGARPWILSKRTRRVKIGALVVAFLFLHWFMVLLLSLILLVGYLVCRIAAGRIPTERLRDRAWSKRAHRVVLAVLLLAVFPLSNYLYLFGGAMLSSGNSGHPLFQINDAGFRGPPLDEDGPPADLTILYEGDSSTFGFPYRAEDTFPFLTARYLEERGGMRVRTLNAGKPGQNLIEIRDRLPHLLGYEPDVLVLMVGVHADDPDFSEPEEEEGEEEGAPEPGVGEVDGGMPGALRYLTRMRPPTLLELLFLSVRWPGTSESEEEEAARVEAGVRLFGQIFDELLRDAQARGIRVVVLEYPTGRVRDDVQETIRETALALPADFIPLKHYFTEGASDYALNDGIHPNLERHELIARELVAVLAASTP